MAFPFDGAWPGVFSIIIEAWHDTTGELFKNNPTMQDIQSGDSARIISRAVVRRRLEPGPWLRDRVAQGHVQLEYDVRVVCDQQSNGANCNTRRRVNCTDTPARPSKLPGIIGHDARL
ncbi:delta-like protein 3 [Pollicipes pollicipes]|uniref:delta-like protein 3 n=1 Tax=Pollicipes pollicipes TaxID=41117 RepID=UPI0018854192|nr:delta-like protein 3 [Pollicipes pollicipes]